MNEEKTEFNRQTDRQTDRQIRRLKNLLVFLLCIVLIGGLGAGAVGYKLYTKVKTTESNVSELRNQVVTLQNEVDGSNFDSSIYVESDYNYLAIGNSITNHPATSYWWNPGVGMAASSQDKDYEHVLATMLESGLSGNEIASSRSAVSVASNVNVVSANLGNWELQYYDRAETLAVLKPYLSSNLDLVTIQLGENASDTTTFESDYEELIKYIQELCPDAKIAVIGEFWKDEDKDSMKKQACDTTGATFVDLSSMWNDTSYQAGMGTVVYDAEGKEHTIEHQGTSSHPGDKGMQKIAELVYAAIKKN